MKADSLIECVLVWSLTPFFYSVAVFFRLYFLPLMVVFVPETVFLRSHCLNTDFDHCAESSDPSSFNDELKSTAAAITTISSLSPPWNLLGPHQLVIVALCWKADHDH
ncbi:hypothetical protein N7495_006070 [Penicillium taxi]|uniref:uncharacterized protein n=1 Tax=Penicillium taxi TaxID=168475 RepID=UPI0025458051|nr:uncharacterized protein N7495_006070 [Penicillium taxi]KAJ5894379.1 hypothetical protein N7495_006070 [Penicillium taxi]